MAGDNLAADYAAGILSDMTALEWLEDHYNDFSDWRLDGLNVAEELPRAMAEDGQDLETIKAAGLMYEDSAESWEEYGGPVACFFANDVLDIETISKASAAARNSSVSAVRALITFGGPNCWVITSDGDDLEILVGWGGDTVRLFADAPAVASYLYELGAA